MNSGHQDTRQRNKDARVKAVTTSEAVIGTSGVMTCGQSNDDRSRAFNVTIVKFNDGLETHRLEVFETNCFQMLRAQ